MAASSFSNEGYDSDFEPEGIEHNTGSNAVVPIGGRLPCVLQIPTTKLLDVILALSPPYQRLGSNQRKNCRKTLNQRFYNRTRPGFYMEISESLHVAYAGQPNGHGTQHHWRLFFDEGLKDRLEVFVHGTALTTSSHQDARSQGNGHYSVEWGGLYLRSQGEQQIAECLDKTGVLFFANARGRVGLHHTLVSDSQLTGRVEVDFLVLHQSKCMVLEVDGAHHFEEGQSIRDYARDRVFLRSGVATVRFTGRDCLERPKEVVSEFLAILQTQ